MSPSFAIVAVVVTNIAILGAAMWLHSHLEKRKLFCGGCGARFHSQRRAKLQSCGDVLCQECVRLSFMEPCVICMQNHDNNINSSDDLPDAYI